MAKKNFSLYIGLILFSGLLVFGCVQQSTQNYKPQTRTYYIAAEDMEWDYAPVGLAMAPEENTAEIPWLGQTKYQKTRFTEYTDETFSTKKEQPKWLGILGPVIRGVEGDTIKVVFYNKASKPYSIHPHGLQYDPDNEGAGTGTGSKINPGEKFTYTWKVTKESAPTESEGGSKTWFYHSHVNAVKDIYSGLIGPIIITSKNHANNDGTPSDVDKEFVTMFFIFNESQEGMSEEETEGHLKHAINGYIFGNLPGLEMNKGNIVRWHMIGMGTEVDLHTAHWHGETVKLNETGTYTDVVELLPASMKSVDMQADNPGEWMFHCHVADHITAGMIATYTIKSE